MDMSTPSLRVRGLGQGSLYRLQDRRVCRSADGKVVGAVQVVAGTTCITKTVVPTRHMLTRPAAWATDQFVLDEAERAGCTYVLLQERTSERYWAASIVAIRAHGLHLDRGHGVQVALPLHRWATGFDARTVLAEARSMAAYSVNASVQIRAGSAQMRLFGT